MNVFILVIMLKNLTKEKGEYYVNYSARILLRRLPLPQYYAGCPKAICDTAGNIQCHKRIRERIFH